MAPPYPIVPWFQRHIVVRLHLDLGVKHLRGSFMMYGEKNIYSVLLILKYLKPHSLILLAVYQVHLSFISRVKTPPKQRSFEWRQLLFNVNSRCSMFRNSHSLCWRRKRRNQEKMPHIIYLRLNYLSSQNSTQKSLGIARKFALYKLPLWGGGKSIVTSLKGLQGDKTPIQ